MMKCDFKNEAETLELKIYDTIGSNYWGGGITTEYIEDQLEGSNEKPLNIYINSGGGQVFEGFAIYNILKRYKGYKTVIVDGIAASIASVIAMAGDKVVMNTASMMMIHNASGFALGNAEEMKKVVSALEQINEVIKDVYKEKTNLDDEKLTELMDAETYLTANDCLDYGFADEINTEEKEETITNSIETLNKLKDDVEQKIKLFNDIKNLGFEAPTQVSKEATDDEGNAIKNKSRWGWLRNGGIN